MAETTGFPKESASSATKPTSLLPPKHTKDSFEVIQNRIAKNEAILIDVRESFEWEGGHLQSGVFLPLSELEEGRSSESFASQLAEKVAKR